jgi:predicted nucleotidyltransferase
LVEVGKAIGRLNNVLPKKQFILMGPGRWGSRGDIKLGVSVTYSEINNTAMLIEIARKFKDYVPDLSFGTHFFQDLVESNIRYLPLYPDENGNSFNACFLENSHSIFENLIPEMNHISKVIRVIDVAEASGGSVLKVLMNAEKDTAVAMLGAPTETSEDTGKSIEETKTNFAPHSDAHWRWRMRSVERIAAKLDADRFGVEALYLIGSVKNATAGPGSDIDLLIHFSGTENQLIELKAWLEGWSLSLSHMNFLRTGYRSDGLLDVHIITDEDIKKKTSFAIKIGAVSDAARLIPIGTELK